MVYDIINCIQIFMSVIIPVVLWIMVPVTEYIIDVHCCGLFLLGIAFVSPDSVPTSQYLTLICLKSYAKVKHIACCCAGM
jgi:hypothetical protein